MATTLAPEVLLMRRRVRHIHIPDLPPLYAPRNLPNKIRDHVQKQIIRQRSLSDPLLAQDPPSIDANHSLGKVSSPYLSWLRRAGPPPTVLSFTRRPTYILPKNQLQEQEPWKADYLVRALKSSMNVHFPKPPGWSSLPWRPFWEHEMPESQWTHDPLKHKWSDVGVLIMPCAEAMFLGPGQVSIWPIIDLEDTIQKCRVGLSTKYEYERVLEDTTIQLLKRKFHIEAFSIPGSAGVWVESRVPPPDVDLERDEASDTKSVLGSLKLTNPHRNLRRIATIHGSVTDGITQWGVSIHVGQPDPNVDSWTRLTNPWTPIRQHISTTSIAAELSHTESTPGPVGSSQYLRTFFGDEAKLTGAGNRAMPYSLIKTDLGRRHPAPLGMDNRDISAAWTYEFARQLGMNDGHVDHYGIVNTDDPVATTFPTRLASPGFKFRGVFSEDVMNRSYLQADVPSILIGGDENVSMDILQDSLRTETRDGRINAAKNEGWLLSWQLWYETLTQKLDEAICGGPCDTRLAAYNKQKEMSVKMQRRRTELKQAEEVQDQWRAKMPQLVRRPLKDSTVKELSELSREMEQQLKTMHLGNNSGMLLDKTIRMRRLLERHFAGPFSRDMVDIESAETKPVSTLKPPYGTARAASEEARTPPVNAVSGEEAATGPLEPAPKKTHETCTPPGKPEAEAESSWGPGPLPLAREEAWVDLTETRQQKRARRLQERGPETLEGFRQRMLSHLPFKPRVFVEFTEPKAKKQREARLKRRVEGQKAEATGAGTGGEAVSPFLPKMHQIGGP